VPNGESASHNRACAREILDEPPTSERERESSVSELHLILVQIGSGGGDVAKRDDNANDPAGEMDLLFERPVAYVAYTVYVAYAVYVAYGFVENEHE
jgi:hypothetical protein